jgi:hypothetical protein
MHIHDFVCDDCHQPVSQQPIPMVVYIVAGIPPGLGNPDLNMPDVQVPTFIRELMAQPVARRDWCVACFAKAFNLPLTAPPAPVPP